MNNQSKNNNKAKVVTLLPPNYEHYKHLFNCLMDELSPFGRSFVSPMWHVNYVQVKILFPGSRATRELTDNQIHTIDAFCRRNDFGYILKWSYCFGLIFIVSKHLNQ